MKIKDYKCKCGSTDFFFNQKRENLVGIYCKSCGKYYKWADKDELNLMKVEAPLGSLPIDDAIKNLKLIATRDLTDEEYESIQMGISALRHQKGR